MRPVCQNFLILFYFFVCVPAIAFAQSPDVPLKYRVTDSFNVGGGNVFVRALAYDELKGQLWVGTSVGAMIINARTRALNQTITRNNGLANEYVFAAFVAGDGAVWLGTNGGGSSRYIAGKWETYFPMHGLGDYWVYSFTEQKDKAVWIGTWAGLTRYDYQSKVFTTYVKELVNEWVYGLDVDSHGQVWVGTEGGVNMFDGETWHEWTHEDGLGARNQNNLGFSLNTGLGTRTRHDLSVLVQGEGSYNPNYVFSVKVAPDDSVWVGTWGGGVSYYDGKRWQNLTDQDGLAANIVYSIAIDGEGKYWFGTNKGVSIYDGKQWATVTKKEGLLDDNVYAIAVAGDGSVWVGTKHGVAVIEKH